MEILKGQTKHIAQSLACETWRPSIKHCPSWSCKCRIPDALHPDVGAWWFRKLQRKSITPVTAAQRPTALRERFCLKDPSKTQTARPRWARSIPWTMGRAPPRLLKAGVAPRSEVIIADGHRNDDVFQVLRSTPGWLGTSGTLLCIFEKRDCL